MWAIIENVHVYICRYLIWKFNWMLRIMIYYSLTILFIHTIFFLFIFGHIIKLILVILLVSSKFVCYLMEFSLSFEIIHVYLNADTVIKWLVTSYSKVSSHFMLHWFILTPFILLLLRDVNSNRKHSCWYRLLFDLKI